MLWNVVDLSGVLASKNMCGWISNHCIVSTWHGIDSQKAGHKNAPESVICRLPVQRADMLMHVQLLYRAPPCLSVVILMFQSASQQSLPAVVASSGNFQGQHIPKGAALLINPGCTVTLTGQTVFEDNSASEAGGAINAYGPDALGQPAGKLLVTGPVFGKNNSAPLGEFANVEERLVWDPFTCTCAVSRRCGVKGGKASCWLGHVRLRLHGV